MSVAFKAFCQPYVVHLPNEQVSIFVLMWEAQRLSDLTGIHTERDDLPGPHCQWVCFRLQSRPVLVWCGWLCGCPAAAQAPVVRLYLLLFVTQNGCSLQIKLLLCKTACWFKCFIWRYLLHKHCFDSVLLKGLRTFCLRSLRQRKREVVLETIWNPFQWTESISL